MYKLNPLIDTQNSVIFTDMDGTLLDHHDYSYQAALPTLEDLHSKGILVVPNTSKTFAELITLRSQIGLTGPFIVENGAAVYIPNDVMSKPDECIEQDGYYIKQFSRPRDYFIKCLSKIPARFDGMYESFSNMSIQRVAELTDLPLPAAITATQRQYGEPIKWLGNASDKRAFIDCLLTLGGHVVEGGRFIHFADKSDKGLAMEWLLNELCKQQGQTFTSLALGDGNNDIAMLEKSDIAIVIKSPVNAPLQLQKTNNVFFTTQCGPLGWAESITHLLLES